MTTITHRTDNKDHKARHSFVPVPAKLAQIRYARDEDALRIAMLKAAKDDGQTPARYHSPNADSAGFKALVESLHPKQRETVMAIVDGHNTTKSIADALGAKVANTLTMLNTLRSKGVLCSQLIAVKEPGRNYQYNVWTVVGASE